MMKKQNVRTLALIVSTFTYLLVGAAIFDAFESSNEADEKENLQEEQDQIQRRYNISDDDMETLRMNIIKMRPYRAGPQWKFAGAFYFSLSVITTIGYGHSTPKTVGGKIFCILYALIGIPLNIVMFQSIGERFNIGITIVLRHVKKCVNLKKTNVTQTELTILACVLCSTVLLGGAGAFHYFENWDFTDAFYYCFITMSTIGFGDYVALQNSTMKAFETRPEYVAFSILYILFGLTVFAAALNLMVLRLLTMNTEDERKDELEALAAARGAVKLEGDVITAGANNNAMTTLVDEEEGMQVEVDDSKEPPYYTQSAISISTPIAISGTNGFLTTQQNKLKQLNRKTSAFINNILPNPIRPPGNRGIIWADSSQGLHPDMTTLDRTEEEDAESVETVFSSPRLPSEFDRNRKRLSV